MNRPSIKISEWLQAGFELYKANFGLLLVVNLVAMVISSITFFILAGPMTAGIIIVTLALIDGKEPKPVVGDLFKGFEVFLPAFLYVLAIAIVSALANLIFMGTSFVVFPVLATLTVFTMFFIVEDRMDFWPAIVRSYNIVKTNFWPFLGLVVVAGILSSVGAILCCIGIILTAPLYYCVIAIAYRAHFPLGSTGSADTITVEPPTDVSDPDAETVVAESPAEEESNEDKPAAE